MSALQRVVFDTSTLVGVALKVGSVPHRALGLALLRLHAHHVDVTVADEAALQPPCRDPKDNKFLALSPPNRPRKPSSSPASAGFFQ